MRTSTIVVVALIVLASTVVRVNAGSGSTAAQKCEAAKLKAVARKTSAKLSCEAKAVLKGVAVDPTCLSKAETAFAGAFKKAEAKGGCASTGNAAAIESQVDSFVTNAQNCIEAHCG